MVTAFLLGISYFCILGTLEGLLILSAIKAFNIILAVVVHCHATTAVISDRWLAMVSVKSNWIFTNMRSNLIVRMYVDRPTRLFLLERKGNRQFTVAATDAPKRAPETYAVSAHGWQARKWISSAVIDNLHLLNVRCKIKRVHCDNDSSATFRAFAILRLQYF